MHEINIWIINEADETAPTALQFDTSDLIEALAIILEVERGISYHHIAIRHNNKILNFRNSFQFYNIKDGDMLSWSVTTPLENQNTLNTTKPYTGKTNSLDNSNIKHNQSWCLETVNRQQYLLKMIQQQQLDMHLERAIETTRKYLFPSYLCTCLFV